MARQGRRRRNLGKPCVLIVDDQLDEASSKCLLFEGLAEALPRTPDDVTLRDLQRADVVLVDFVLDAWETPADRALAERPNNGVALAAVYRSHAGSDSQTAFALHSGQLDGLSGGLPPESHLHAIARMNNLEWVFSKKDAQNARAMHEQVLSLAHALRSLPKGWPTGQPGRMRGILENLLSVPKGKWQDRAWQDIENCHPPIHVLSPPTHAITLVRWLLSSILPYPTFLWDVRYFAARLRVTPTSLRDALNRESALTKKLSPYRYKGVLADFLGERWWRPGIEHFLWEMTKADPFDPEILKKVARQLSRGLEPISLSEPVVAYDDTLRATYELIELSDAVELQPDDWPAYAARPWANRDLAEGNSRLRSLVVSGLQ